MCRSIAASNPISSCLHLHHCSTSAANHTRTGSPSRRRAAPSCEIISINLGSRERSTVSHANIAVASIAPRAELLLCAKHLFVAAMGAGVHPAKQNMTEGSPSVKFSGAAKAKRRRHHRQARFAPCRGNSALSAGGRGLPRRAAGIAASSRGRPRACSRRCCT
jgi:hypothetical protein